jgi:hypothetical protein
MEDWYDISDPSDPQLDEMAVRFGISRAHVEACRSDSPRARVERMPYYLFVTLKLAESEAGKWGVISAIYSDEWLITVHDKSASAAHALLDVIRRSRSGGCKGILHGVLKGVVTSYKRNPSDPQFIAGKLALREAQTALKTADVRELRPIETLVDTELDAFEALDSQSEIAWREQLIQAHRRTQKLIIGFGSAVLLLLAIGIAVLIFRTR